MRRIMVAASIVMLAACGGGNGQDSADPSPAGEGTETSGAGSSASSSGDIGASLRAGQWETTTEIVRMSMPNMPAGMTPPVPPPTTVSMCLTPEQVQQTNGGFLTGNADGNCRTENLAMTGGRIQGQVICENAGASMHATVSGKFTPDSYELEQRVRTSSEGQNIDLEARVRGRRTGDCAA